MYSIGFRISPTDWTHVVLSGSVDEPAIEAVETVKFPPGMTDQESLAWFRDEIAGLLGRFPVEAANFRRREPQARGSGKSVYRRYEFEGVLQEVILSTTGTEATPLVQRQIKSRLGFDGKANAVDTIPGSFPQFTDVGAGKQADACVVALCGLPE